MEKTLQTSIKKRVKGEARKKAQSRSATLDKNGSEILDETPLFVELGQKPQLTMDQKIRQITIQVQAETAAKLAAQKMSPEEVQRILDEEDNFEIPDDFTDNLTVYEAQGLVSELQEQIVVNPTPPSEPLEEPPPPPAEPLVVADNA